MKKLGLPLLLAGVLAAGAIVYAAGAPRTGDAPAQDRVARGAYLVDAIGCADCHTPHKLGASGPEPDRALWLSGHPSKLEMPPPPELSGPWVATAGATMTAWAGPWGTSFTANLTPDEETGLGRWTLEQFRDVIRTGRHLGRGRPLLPPMPWQYYRNLSDEDLHAIFAYLRSIPAISNRVPEPMPPEEAR